VIETILKNIFELKEGEIADMKLLELINTNHENFIATNTCEKSVTVVKNDVINTSSTNIDIFP
jgi:uncharacterized protein with FMN-binding domain